MKRELPPERAVHSLERYSVVSAVLSGAIQDREAWNKTVRDARRILAAEQTMNGGKGQ
jgi:hypothetical protein